MKESDVLKSVREYGARLISEWPITTALVTAWMLFLCFPKESSARTIYFGSETETIPIVYGPASIFRFPVEVRTISRASQFEITPANADSPNYAVLSVRPRLASGTSTVAFILSDGTTIQTKLVVVSKEIPEKTDGIYEFKSKDSTITANGESKTGAELSELELMKAMLRGDEVSGYEVKNLSRTISPGFKGVSTHLVRIYTGSQFNGYIFEIENVTKDQRLFINNKNLMLGDPNTAILSSVDNPVIDPQGKPHNKTYLRVVAKPTSLYNQLVLPIQATDKKGGAL